MTTAHTWTALSFVLPITFWTASLYAAVPAKSIDDVRVFAIYEPVFSQQDVELLSRVHPDFICRGWFKWHNTPDWQAYAPLAQACREKGLLLQGGITLAALYPGENGMDDAAFRDFACHGTDGHPYHCRQADFGGWYHLSLYNPKVIEYVKREVRLQIDAGAVGIWYDEIEGYYDWNPTEGYDPYACAAFRDWLIRKYCAGQGWCDADPRWQTRFGIDLAKHGGSIRTFDYLRHLQTTPGKDGKPLADNPPQGNPRGWATSANPLYREWGYAWNRKAQGTFRFDTVAAIFADILADADRYAREKYGRALISTYNHNGTARPGVAFQQPHNGAQPPLRNNRLDGRGSYLSYYETLIRDAAEVCPEQPVVFFVDWPGETDRLTAMSRADQTHFFSLYIPEAYAAGGEFALPLRGYSYIAVQQGTLATLARMADFYREYAPFLRGSRALPQQPEAPDRLTLRVRATAAGTAVHLVNHAFSTSEVWPIPRTNLTVRIPWTAPLPSSAFAVSPDFPEQRPVALSLQDGQLALKVGTVTCSALVLLPHTASLRPVTGSAADGTHILDQQGRALSVARGGRFTLWLPAERTEASGPLARLFGRGAAAPDLECLETGERQPARDGVSFTPLPAGDFATGLLLDTFALPARHAEIAQGARRWHTDAWGRFRIPRAAAAAGPLTARIEPGQEHALAPGTTFTAWRAYALRMPILSLPAKVERPRQPQSANIDGFWANWPDKELKPGVITLARDWHQARDALRCNFSPTPRVSWSNVNSPSISLGEADLVEVTYAGDGSPRTVYAVLQAHPHFYRTPLSLAEKGWTTKRIALGEFRDDNGRPFDPSTYIGNLAFQLAPAALGDTPATLWLQGVALVTDVPIRTCWQNAADFDEVDVDNLRAAHRPQVPPPAAAKRQPLVRFTEPSQKLLANWAGKSAADTKPMVVIERIAPANEGPFLRVTFPAGECDWGNANIPLPADKLKGQDGLAFRIRAKPSVEAVALALHAMSRDHQNFYNADCEVGETWTELVVPWSEFRRDDQHAFQPAQSMSANLQIRRPEFNLMQELVIDIEQIDTFSTKRQ